VTDLITIEGIEAFGYHGVFPEERREGQTFIVDVEIHTPLGDAAQSDDVAHTVDYGVVANRVEAARVTVHKPAAPIQVPFSDVSVTMHREAGPR
jgi:dihydroneopterin aldolase